MEKEFTCIEWIKYYKEEVEKIVDYSPFLSILCISAGIEYMGKLLSVAPLDDGTGCSGKFENALSSFESLRKYEGKDLYNLIRCGLAHRISVKEGIVLSTTSQNQLDNSPLTINVKSFFDDFVKAVEEAQSKTDWSNPDAQKPYMTINNDSETGSTLTMQYQ